MKGSVEQGWRNRRKIIVAAIRLEQSIIADNIINRIMDAEYKKYYKAVQEGRQLPPFDPKKTLGVD